MCWCFIFHLSCGERSRVMVILPCSGPGLCTLKRWRLLINQPSQLMTLLSVRKWQAKDDRFQGSDCRTSAAAALTYTSVMIASKPFKLHRHSSVSYLGVVRSFDEPLLEKLLFHHCSRPPGSSIFIHLLICEHRLINRIPVHHSLETQTWKHAQSSIKSWASTKISSCCYFMFNIPQISPKRTRLVILVLLSY